MDENPIYVFERLVARPMKINHYAWTLDYAKQPYGGGGMLFQLRDYIPRAQAR